MTFLQFAPWVPWVVVIATVATATALFTIRPRPATRTVSSLMIWHRVLDETRQRSWWDRLRWLVSLFLTLLITAAIAVAFARPAVSSTTPPARILIVLDSSWSMRARTASGATRWELALQGAQATAEAWSDAQIALATTAEGVIQAPTSDMSLTRRAISSLQPSGGTDGSWPQLAGATAVHLFSDGSFDRAMPSDVVVHSVFAPATNVAITAFESQAAGGEGAGSSVFVAVENFALKPQIVRVTVARTAQVLVDHSVEIGAGGIHRESIPVASNGDPRFRAHVSAAENALDIDDDASAWLFTAQPLRVAVVGERSPAVSLLGHDPGVRVTTVEPSEYARTKTDVWVLDGWLPPERPTKPVLVIDPPPSAWLGKRGNEETRPIWTPGPKPAHPILDGVDASLVQLEHSRAVLHSSLQPIVVSAQGTSLVAVENTSARRQVVFSFSLRDSTLVDTPAFPILVGNAIDWLGRPFRNLHHRPGAVAFPVDTTRILAPSGRSVPIAKFDDYALATLNEPGLYLVQSHEGQRVIRVTLGDMRRSNLLVRTSTSAPSAPVHPKMVRTWWARLATAALILILIEWMTWQRRITV